MIRRASPSTPPDQKTWAKSLEVLKEAMNKAKKQLQISKEKLNHRRGEYEFISGGISYGGGQKVSNIIRLYYA